MRVRSINQVTSHPYISPLSRWTTGGGNVVYTVPNNTGMSNGRFEYMQDVVSDHFRRRRAAGEIIINPMVSLKETVEVSGSRYFSDTIQTIGGAGWTDVERVLYQHPYVNYTTLSAAYLSPGGLNGSYPGFNMPGAYGVEDQLILQAAAKAASPDVQALVTMAELNKTLDLVFETAVKAQRCVSWLRGLPTAVRDPLLKLKLRSVADLRGMRKKLPKALFSAASTWLQYRYGFMATYYDVQSWVGGLDSFHRLRLSSSITTSASATVVVPPVQDVWRRQTVTHSYGRFTRSSAGVLVSMDVSIKDNEFVQRGGLNLLSTAWELVPFSFVLDWIAGFGDRIAALEGSVIAPTRGAWIVHRHNLSAFSNTNWAMLTTISGDGTARYIRAGEFAINLSRQLTIVERKANPVLPVLPPLNVKLNWKKCLDGVALLTQVGKNFRKF